MLTEEKLRQLSANEMVYRRGIDLYQRGAVPKPQIIQEGSRYIVRGYVEGERGNEYYNVVELSEDGDDIYFECECPAAYTYEGACKHTIAMLLKFMELNSRKTLEVHHVDKASGIALLDYYEEALMKNRDIQKKHCVKAVPKLVEIRANHFALSLSIGIDKLYVVKDIEAFVRQILQEETVSYGKNLAFTHCIDAFTEEAKPLVEFVVGQFMDREQILDNVSGGKIYRIDKNLLLLTPSGMDEFFYLYKGMVVTIQDEHGVVEVELLEENPSFNFRVEKEQNQFALYPNTKHYQIIENPLYEYIWTNDKLYRVSKSFAKEVLPVLKFMQEVYPPKLSFDELNFKRFVANLFKGLTKHGEVQIDERILEDYKPPELLIRFYLDRDEKQCVSGEVIFDYEGCFLNPFDEDKNSFVGRDFEKEQDFLMVLTQLGFKKHLDKVILEEEEAIYALLTEGFELLLQVCEVHITDQLKDMKLKTSPIGSIGLKLKSNLLEISLKDMTVAPGEVQSILQAYKQKKKYYRLKDGTFIDLWEEDFECLSEMVDTLKLKEKDIERGVIEVGKFRALYLETLLNNTQKLLVEKDQGFKSMVKKLKSREETEETIPSSLESVLRSYQRTGYLWLYTMASYGFGGVLADDMGLGKTLQVIALLLKEKENNIKVKPSLVVAPTSLVLNWKKEIRKFAPKLQVQVISGNSSERLETFKALDGVDVVITSYDLLKRDEEAYGKIKFKYCIADEAQAIKNPHTQNAKTIKKIKSEINFALTGTPMENNLSELWSLFDFCMPGYLYSYHQFKASFETPIMRMEDQRAMSALKRMIAPFILRRMKKDVLKELPSKTETILYNKMEEEQEILYHAHLALVQKEFAKELEAYGFRKSHMKILAMLTRLRQLCCHPSLYLEDYKGESSKLKQCMEIVTECTAGGHKVLIFSQFTTMLHRIGQELTKEGISYYLLTGQTKAEKRMEMVEDFQLGHSQVFLISLKAGGTGLNLTEADVVIHYDPWWNVSSEQQATDRVYRIGQEKPVQVFKLITENTIEEKIKELQEKKINLSQSVLEKGENFISQMTEEEIYRLFH